MRTDSAYLLDMLIAARKLRRYVEGLTFADFGTNELVQSAVIREFLVLGEAARQISDKTKAAQPAIDWPTIIGMRNHLVHGYFAIDLDIVWRTIEHDITPLITLLEMLLPRDPTEAPQE